MLILVQWPTSRLTFPVCGSSIICYIALRKDKDPCMLTIVSTMFGLELRSVLAAKNTSTMLWWRIISRIMVQAQKVPLRPPPFLLQKQGTQTQRHRPEAERHEWPNKDVAEQLRQPLRGGATEWNVTVWLSADQARCQKKANWQAFKMNIWVKFSLKYRCRDLIRCELSYTQPDLQRSKGPDMETGAGTSNQTSDVMTQIVNFSFVMQTY